MIVSVIVGFSCMFYLMAYMRKTRRRGHAAPLPTAKPFYSGLFGHRHRRRRRDHRPRNPTLAETGGLPPLRDESKPPGPP